MKGNVKIDPYAMFSVQQEEEESSDSSQDGDVPDHVTHVTDRPVICRSQSFTIEGSGSQPHHPQVIEALRGAEIPPVAAVWRGGRHTRNRLSSHPAASVMEAGDVRVAPLSQSHQQEQEKKDRSKVMTFLKKFSRRRSKRKNSVQEIHINPEVDEERWASRSVNEGSSGNTSRTSSGDGTGNKRAGNSAIGNSVLETNSCEDVNEMKELNPYQPNFTS